MLALLKMTEASILCHCLLYSKGSVEPQMFDALQAHGLTPILPKGSKRINER